MVGYKDKHNLNAELSNKFKQRIRKRIEDSMFENFICNKIDKNTALIKVNLERAVFEFAIIFNHYTEKIIKSDYQNYIFDLSDTLFMDSTFLGSIIVFHKKLHKKGGELSLVISTNKLVLLSEISCLNQIMKIHKSVDEAIASINEKELKSLRLSV